ncbi:hypothetical protein [Metaclostridioides mangenotii]|uniref:hypothetical protein n=1 Tax=Metaclostridioides mangenotii TaxID=1540 RepID=UPI000486EEC9|nr:hypothetical protein [Clostridioides mangenotii]
MSDLKEKDLVYFDEIFRQNRGKGYVINFSDSAFETFVMDSTGKYINDEKYKDSTSSNSKEKRLRRFILLEDNYLVVKLLRDLIDYWYDLQTSHDKYALEDDEEHWYNECKEIIEKLKNSTVDIDKLNIEEDKNFPILVSKIKHSIDIGEVGAGLGELHTYMVRFFRLLCNKYSLHFEKDEPLHSLAGKCIKAIERENKIETAMGAKLLKSNIDFLDKFNPVRNDRSLSHDNDIINNKEAIYLLNSIITLKSFIDSIEEEYI